MLKETVQDLAPAPAPVLTWDPRESITWPRGWITADGVHVRLAPLGSLYPFEYFAGSWVVTDCMGPLPHGRVR